MEVQPALKQRECCSHPVWEQLVLAQVQLEPAAVAEVVVVVAYFAGQTYRWLVAAVHRIAQSSPGCTVAEADSLLACLLAY